MEDGLDRIEVEPRECGDRGLDARTPSVRTALVTLAASLVLLMLSAWLMVTTPLVEPLSAMEYKFAGALILEMFAVGLPMAVLFRPGRYDIRASLGLRAVGVKVMAGAVLAGIGLVVVAPQLEAWQSRLIAPPEGYMEGLTEFLSADSGGSLIGAMLALALVPALLEEALFRGVLLRSVLSRCGRWPSILAVGVMFGLFHLDFYRWPILAVIGVLLTWIAVRTGSLWPSVAAHLANNALAVCLINLPSVSAEKWVEGVSDVPPAFFISGVGLIALGSSLVIKGSADGASGAPPDSTRSEQGN